MWKTIDVEIMRSVALLWLALFESMFELLFPLDLRVYNTFSIWVTFQIECGTFGYTMI